MSPKDVLCAITGLSSRGGPSLFFFRDALDWRPGTYGEWDDEAPEEQNEYHDVISTVKTALKGLVSEEMVVGAIEEVIDMTATEDLLTKPNYDWQKLVFGVKLETKYPSLSFILPSDPIAIGHFHSFGLAPGTSHIPRGWDVQIIPANPGSEYGYFVPKGRLDNYSKKLDCSRFNPNFNFFVSHNSLAYLQSGIDWDHIPPRNPAKFRG